MLLYRSRWPLKQVLQLCVQRPNCVENAVRASGPTPEVPPKYEEFVRVLDLSQDLNQSGHLDLVYEAPSSATKAARIVLQVAPESFSLPQTRELWNLLGLLPDRRHYPVTYQLIEHARERELDHLEVETRSVLGMLFFLSQSVEVPLRDVQTGRVTLTRAQSGEVFDWRNVTHQLLRIHSVPVQPVGAAVSVCYRGSWFYIDDADLSSKSTFALLTQLVAIQSCDIAKLMPVLALPIGK